MGYASKLRPLELNIMPLMCSSCEMMWSLDGCFQTPGCQCHQEAYVQGLLIFGGILGFVVSGSVKSLCACCDPTCDILKDMS